MERKHLLISLGVGAACVGTAGAIYYAYRRHKTPLLFAPVSTWSGVWTQPQLGSFAPDLSKIHVVSSQQEWDAVCKLLYKDIEQCPILGLDCEWVFDNKVSLLQIATVSNMCILVRLNMLDAPPPELITVLQLKNILKVGVAVCDDAKKLYQDYSLTVRGCVDLRYVAGRCQVFKAFTSGLKRLSESVLGYHLPKVHNIRCGDWEAAKFSKAQIDYAAKDALVAVHIFTRLLKHKLQQRAKRAGQPDTDVPNDDAMLTKHHVHDSGAALWQGLVDVPFKHKLAKHKVEANRQAPLTAPDFKKTSAQLQLEGKKPAKQSYKESYSTRKKPLYHNCQLHAPDGTLLCTCDEKKALWYIDKGLGVKINDSPIIVQLNFEPSGRPNTDRDYYLQDKENRCVVCGVDFSYIRKNIVPKEYRKHFPYIMKEHKSHDIVLLCTSCHYESSLHDSVLREQLAIQCDAPLSKQAGAKYQMDYDLQRVCSAGKALYTNKANLPAQRIAALEQIIVDYLGISGEDVNEDAYKEALNVDPRNVNPTYMPHGLKVVRHMTNQQGGLIAFEKRWREHFLSTMKPRFLPSLWSVEHRHEQLKDMADSMHHLFDDQQSDSDGENIFKDDDDDENCDSDVANSSNASM